MPGPAFSFKDFLDECHTVLAIPGAHAETSLYGAYEKLLNPARSDRPSSRVGAWMITCSSSALPESAIDGHGKAFSAPYTGRHRHETPSPRHRPRLPLRLLRCKPAGGQFARNHHNSYQYDDGASDHDRDCSDPSTHEEHDHDHDEYEHDEYEHDEYEHDDDRDVTAATDHGSSHERDGAGRVRGRGVGHPRCLRVAGCRRDDGGVRSDGNRHTHRPRRMGAERVRLRRRPHGPEALHTMPDDGLSRSALDRGAFSSVTPFAKELKVAFGVGPTFGVRNDVVELQPLL